MNNQKGFTLIEMLVVIAIVGLLSSVVVVGLSGAREKARDARRMADIRGMQNGLELEYGAGGYPDTGDFTVVEEDPLGVSSAYAYLKIDAETDGFNEGYILGVCVETATNVSDDDCGALSITCGNQYEGKLCVVPQ